MISSLNTSPIREVIPGYRLSALWATCQVFLFQDRVRPRLKTPISASAQHHPECDQRGLFHNSSMRRSYDGLVAAVISESLHGSSRYVHEVQ